LSEQTRGKEPPCNDRSGTRERLKHLLEFISNKILDT